MTGANLCETVFEGRERKAQKWKRYADRLYI